MNKTKITISTILALILIAALCAGISLWALKGLIWPFVIALVLILIVDAICAIRIIASRRSSYAKACWFLVIMLLPIIGIIIFIIFGINPLLKRQRKEYLNSQKNYINHEDFRFSQQLMKSNSADNWLFSYGLNNMYKPVYNNNHIEIIEDNTRLFEESIKLIRSAKQYINIQSYIFDYSGFWSKIFFAELIKKANTGVKVRLIYDWLGVHGRVDKKVFKDLSRYGIEVACFNPSGISMFKGATNYRLHSKFVIVDNKTALYGGSNFADEYLSMARDNSHWKDLNYLVTGPVVNSMNITFINYWTRFSEKTVSKFSNANLVNDTNLILEKQKFEPSNTLAQLLIFEPDWNEFELENTLNHAFYNAKKSIKILTPYFACPYKVIEALKYCHSKGIKIEIIAHNKNQNFVQMVNRENYKKLADIGVSVYEYDGYLHSKGMIIDDEYVLTGSCNIDYRSIYLDFESELVIKDKDFVSQMSKVFENTKKNSTLQTSKMLAKKLNLWTRFILKLLNIGKSLF